MSDDHHDGDFATDFNRTLQRRRVLGLLGLAGAGGLTAWAFTGGPGQAETNVIATGPDGATCVKLPGETAGPYPGDGSNRLDGATINVLTETGILRSDIRSGFGGLGGMADGIEVDLELTLVDAGESCAPLSGLAIYLWHCDASGNYSIYSLPETNYLRGLQTSDEAGQVRFTTIFPGCYDGRWPHMHFEVFASPEAAVAGKNSLLTAQLAYAEADCVAAYADPRYAGSTGPLSRVSLSRDNVFRDNTPEQIAQQTLQVSKGEGTALIARGTIPLII